jgi:hypothetical protein
MEETYYIKISPESISNDIIQETLSGNTFGVYSAMTSILSGGTGGTSLLTGLTIPIVFNQTYEDLGYFTPFDGYILQKDVVASFITSGDPTNQWTIRLFNTSNEFKKFTKLSSYSVDWGDGNTDILNSTSPNYISHTYPFSPDDYIITITQTNPWGLTTVRKPVYLPVTGATINNPDGNITFTPQGGSWSGIPLNYNFIFTGDSENTISEQTSDNFTTVPFVVTGFTTSRLMELKQYGQIPYIVGFTVSKNGLPFGEINQITTGYTFYTINGVDYYDYPDGTTFFIAQSSGFTSDNITQTPITKEEVLLNVVGPPEIQSEIFIERGKMSAFEPLQRLGEVDNVGDLQKYGYKYFKINNSTQ